MKKYIYSLFVVFLSTVTMTSCSENEGVEPGNDSDPVVTIYQYEAKKPNNPDNDIVLRFAANNQTNEAYLLTEKTADKASHLASMGVDGYMDYVVSNGTKIDGISGISNADVTLTGLYGACTITAVAVKGNKKTATEITFTGLEWTDVATGVYDFNAIPKLGLTSTPTVLQICTTNAKLYRFKDVFGTGYSLKINLIDITRKNEDGEYQFFRVPIAETSFTYGNYGTVSVRDMGYWQGDDAYVTEGGYESGMYTNHSCFICIQYFVSGDGLGYGYDFFIAD